MTSPPPRSPNAQDIERTAVIAQARKWVQRLAADIHNGPLQDLKVIMDRLELLQSQYPSVPLDPILGQLETLGTHLRHHLSNTKAIALEISPELRNGLDQGIKNHLAQLTQSRDLTLKVIPELQAIAEPPLNSDWLEAREDIYRFFKEAIQNVIRHAQPPEGNATQVNVSLEQQNFQVTLTVENDGAYLDPTVLESNISRQKQGGYGLKLMRVIADELPEGKMRHISPKKGGFCLQLTWKQDFMTNSVQFSG